jgi:transposase
VPTDDFAQLSLQFVDHTQWRYEVIRPLVLFADRMPRQRAHETATHPATVRALNRRFRHRGMLGLLPEDVEVSVRARALRVPEIVREELDRLKALYDGFRYRELARILFITYGVSVDHKTVKALWQASAVSCQGHLGLWDYHAQPNRYQARMQVITLYYQGWEKISIHRFLRVSRPTIDAWVQRFETEHVAGLVDKSPAPRRRRAKSGCR